MAKIIIGIDEAGRWPWAGPVVAWACLFLKKTKRLQNLITKLDDSKKLTEKQREQLYIELLELEKSWAILTGCGKSEASRIDEIGIKPANKEAMKQALTELLIKYSTPQLDIEIQIDGNDKFSLHDTIASKSIIRWDSKVKQISAASIIAKVTRDHLMQYYGKIYPDFGFEIHKWYGTKRHSDALDKFGICALHRKSFAPIKRILEKNWF